MNNTELEMYNTLVDLKENYNVCGIKISFEDEGLTGEMAQMISSIAFKAGVPVSMKIGGCEAKRDMYDAKVMGVDKIVAPMIETPYALKKFIEASHKIYSDDEWKNTKFMMNIETITGYNNLEKMLMLPEAKDIYGIVLGRVDFSGSLNKDRSFVNSPEMSEIANNMANLAKQYEKKLFIGGGVSFTSLDFFRALPQDVLASFETRNIIFDSRKALNNKDIEMGLAKAQGFELAWMKRKKECYGYIANSETARINMIEDRYQKSMSILANKKHSR